MLLGIQRLSLKVKIFLILEKNILTLENGKLSLLLISSCNIFMIQIGGLAEEIS